MKKTVSRNAKRRKNANIQPACMRKVSTKGKPSAGKTFMFCN